MPKLSIVLGTARDSYAMTGLPNTHIFQPTLEGLKRQTWQDFELIVSDALYELRPDTFHGEPFNREDYPFPIKHIPVKPYSPWLQKGMWGHCAGNNRGIIHSEGEAILTIGDCSEFKSPHILHRYWWWYKKGYIPMALYICYHDGEPSYTTEEGEQAFHNANHTEQELHQVETFFAHGDMVRDSRWKYVEKSSSGIIKNCRWDWFYGWAVVPTEAYLKINGWDENLDGTKGLEDVDVGSRLQMAGYDNLVIDKKLWLITHKHGAISNKVINAEVGAFKSNYSLILLNRKKHRYRANSYKLTEEEANWIMEHGTHWSIPRPEGYSERFTLFWWWVENPPIYDLQEERMLV